MVSLGLNELIIPQINESFAFKLDLKSISLKSSSSSKFYFQQNTTMEQYQEKENTL